MSAVRKDRLMCHHTGFYILGGSDKNRCQDCGLSATDAVQWQRERIYQLERELERLRERVAELEGKAQGDAV